MNLDRNKIVMIFGGALIGAALLTWLLYSVASGSKQQKLTSVYAASRDLPAGTRLKKSDVRKVEVADKDIPRGAVMEEKILLDRVLLFPVASNESITVSKLASSGGVEGVAAIIEPGKRAVSVSVNDTSGAAGLVAPRSHVDVLFTRTGSMAEAATTTILQDVTVLSVGRATEVVQQTTASGTTQAASPTAPASTQARAVTLLVTPEQAEKVELAKNQGKLSLALRNPLDRSTSDTNAPTTAVNLYDPTAIRKAGVNPFAKGAQGRGGNTWSSLTGEPMPAAGPPPKPEKKEPPKPRFVVDVYRGEKHVQEIFQ